MNSNLKKLIFDIGMFDGADTRYYLNKGYKVLAVEANTVLVKRAKEILFNEHINNGDLTILNFALTDGTKKNVSLTISATEPGASTILDDEYYNYGSITVQAISIQELFNIQNQKFTTITCSQCQYTEIYRGDSNAVTNVLDFFTN